MATPTTDAASGPIRVQFGAYAIEDNAHKTQWAVEATGMAVEVTRMPSPKGRMLYYVRSQPFSDRTAALTAASTARDKAKGFVNAEPIEFVLVDDSGRPVSQTQAAQR
jgi:cell division protein FtsN